MEMSIDSLLERSNIFKIRKSVSDSSIQSMISTQEVPKTGARMQMESHSQIGTISAARDPLAVAVRRNSISGLPRPVLNEEGEQSMIILDNLVSKKRKLGKESDRMRRTSHRRIDDDRIEEEPEGTSDSNDTSYEFKRTFLTLSKPKTNSTPNKRRRTMNLFDSEMTMPSPIIPSKKVSRRNTISHSEVQKAMSPQRYRCDSVPPSTSSNESTRLTRAAKTKAAAANEQIITVWGRWDTSSMEETTSGSVAEELSEQRNQETDENDKYFAWNEYTDGRRDEYLFSDKEFMEKLKPHVLDERSKEEFDKGLRELGQLIEDNFLSESRKDFDPKIANQRTYIRTSYGRYSHVKSSLVEKAEECIMGSKKYLSVKEYVNAGGHAFIKNDYSSFVRELEEARKQRRKISDWFSSKKGTRMAKARDKYLSIVCQLARKGLWKIEKALEGKMEVALADARMKTQAKKMELIVFQRKLKILSETLTNEEILKELSLSNPTILYKVIPVPTSKELCSLLIDHILTEKYARRKIKDINVQNMTNIMPDKKGKTVITMITHYLNKNPLNYLKIIEEKADFGAFSNRILRTKKTKHAQNNVNKQSEDNAREMIRKGEIPNIKLPQGIPNPQNFLRLELGGNSKNIKDFKSMLGRTVHGLQGVKSEKKKGNEEKLPPQKIINPSNADIHKLVEEINRRNKEAKESNQSLVIVSCNPGKLGPSTIRDIHDNVPDANIILVNELRADPELVGDDVMSPPNFQVYYNADCPNGLVYSATYVSKDYSHLVTKLPNIGTATNIKIKLTEKRSLNISNVYRNIEKQYSDECFYKVNYNSNCLIFADWMEKCVNLSKPDNADVILAGDWNCDTTNPRPQDNSALVERLNRVTKNQKNVIKYNTFFRGKDTASAIDYFMMSDARNAKVQSMNFHREPLKFDGHTGHKITVNVRGLNKLYELKIRSKYDEEGIRKSSMIEAEKLRRSNIKDPEKYIEEAFKVASKIIEDNQTKEASIGLKTHSFRKRQPPDTKKYYEAINFTNSYLYDKEGPGKDFSEEECKALTSFVRSLGIMLKKLQRRDNENMNKKMQEDCQNPLSAAWKITGELLEEPPVRELDENVEELMDEVLKLQKATTLSAETYTKHSFSPKVNVKIDKFRVSVDSKGDGYPAILSEYRKLKDFTKGSTGISRKMLDLFHVSAFFDLIAKPILLAIRNGIYPASWRTNRTVILAKKGRGIRPISISEIFAKILEKIIIAQITEFVENNGLLPSEQNGFRANLSTGTSLAAVNLFACKALDDEEVVSIICIDMKNAFGTPKHANLVKCFGNLFSGNALKIISGSLERWAIVNKDGLMSRREQMEGFGVPQGSVCSPTLFCLYISEIVNVVGKKNKDAQVNIFADDTVLSVKGQTVEEMKRKAEDLLDKMNDKLVDLGLQLVPSKTALMVFGKNNEDSKTKIRVLDTEVEESDTLKYLGSTMGKANGVINYEINNELKISKMRIMSNRIKSIKNYVGSKAANTIHRAFNIGVLNHNLDILPKWKSKTHIKGQNLYTKNLRNSSSDKWYYKEKVYEAIKREERIQALTRAGHPTFFESQMKLFHGQIFKALRFNKCEEVAEELRSCLTMFSVDTGEKIGLIPDIFEEDRIKDDYDYFKKQFGIARKSMIARDQCVINELIKTMIELDHIELRIIPNKNIGRIKKEICWPYNLHKDFNTLPREIRSGVTNLKHKSIVKNYFVKRHKHPENKLDCHECIDKELFMVPEWIEEPTIHEFNNTGEINIIQELKNERIINTGEARFEAICEALDETDRRRPEMNLAVLNGEWMKRGSKKWSLKRCLNEIQSLCGKVL
ncbi:unnamed protein product [Oikopleura dioica]|uniref:Reverse transcriptase domain-containing protein n=1 Tax=Oikopleura dioica TaxID=34765 RepID=E4XHY6_OIKDI|nr:unnamed protein product [Oikopleura dioica]